MKTRSPQCGYLAFQLLLATISLLGCVTKGTRSDAPATIQTFEESEVTNQASSLLAPTEAEGNDQSQTSTRLVSHTEPAAERAERVTDDGSVSDGFGSNAGRLASEAGVNWPAATLDELEVAALSGNPTLKRLFHEYRAAQARAGHVGGLPDPKLAFNIFGHPIETAAGSQRSNVSLSQLVPWLPRLEVKERQACLEAASLWQLYRAEQQALLAQLRTRWYRSYAVHQQLERIRAQQKLVERVIELANARLATGRGSQQDVLSATMAYADLERQHVELTRSRRALQTQIDRIVGSPNPNSWSPKFEPVRELPAWELEFLLALIEANQPRLEAARVQTFATRWGIELARLRQLPDISLNASWFAIDDNRPDTNQVEIGRDAWAFGAMVNLPVRRGVYRAMEREARWRHLANSVRVSELEVQFDALVIEAWHDAVAASKSAQLYEHTLLPQARRLLETDEAAYRVADGALEPVLDGLRSVLTLESSYHREISALNVALARIYEATGAESLAKAQPTPAPLPDPAE